MINEVWMSLILGCEYGDREPWCSTIQAYECYDENTRLSCCETCSKLRQPQGTSPHSLILCDNENT